MKMDHLRGILHLIERDMGASIGGESVPAYPDDRKEAEVIVKGGEANITMGEGAREPLTSEQVKAYRDKMAPIKEEKEDLHNKIVGLQMALERAELDTQITIDV
jgi:hypothetical protein